MSLQMRTIVFAMALAVAVPSVSSAAGQWVRFVGCPVAGAEPSCITVRSGRTTYNVSAAMPKIRIRGLGVIGRGLVSGGMSTCMQGVALHGISYTYTRQRCPNPRR
jgi:hypothetical protein